MQNAWSCAAARAFTHAVQHCELKLRMPLIEHARLAVLHGSHDGRTRCRSDHDTIGSGRHLIKKGVVIIELPHGTKRETSVLRQPELWLQPAGSPFSQLDPMSCRPSGNIMVLSCLNLHLNYGIHLANISTTWPHHKQNRDQQLIRRPETETACSLCSFVIVAPSHTPWLIRFLSPLIQVALHLLAIWESWASSVTWKMCGSQRQLLATVLPLYQHIKTISEARNEKTPRWTEHTSLLISAKKKSAKSLQFAKVSPCYSPLLSLAFRLHR